MPTHPAPQRTKANAAPHTLLTISGGLRGAVDGCRGQSASVVWRRRDGFSDDDGHAPLGSSCSAGRCQCRVTPSDQTGGSGSSSSSGCRQHMSDCIVVHHCQSGGEPTWYRRRRTNASALSGGEEGQQHAAQPHAKTVHGRVLQDGLERLSDAQLQQRLVRRVTVSDDGLQWGGK